MSKPLETILIVDDQEENLRVVGSMLAMMSYRTIAASNAAQAHSLLAAHGPDLILLDMLMPGTDGLTLCRQIKADARWTDLPVIFLSAADDKNLIVQALEAGGVDYVTKPFNMAELVSRVRTQLSLKHARDALRVLAEDKDEILGILAHDLKNHLAGMKISADLLQSRVTDLPPRCVPLVENICHSSNRMLAFINEFLANQSAERMPVKGSVVELGALVASLTRIHQSAAGAKGIALVTDVPERAVMVQGDDQALRQVLDNIISNAIKFTPPGGKVEVRVMPALAGMAKCAVRDSGPGFTAEDREKMFRRYGRLSARPTGDEPSTGLGLSIVKRLLDVMGGTVIVTDDGRPGAEFVISMPVAAEASKAA